MIVYGASQFQQKLNSSLRFVRAKLDRPFRVHSDGLTQNGEWFTTCVRLETSNSDVEEAE